MTRRLPYISHVCTKPFRRERSNGPGRCQKIMTALNDSNAVQGAITNLPTARTPPADRPRYSHRPTRRRTATGKEWSSGTHGAPRTTRIATKNDTRMCPTMWT